MKKIFVMMAAAVAALGFTSCSNDVEELAESSKEFKLDITVADLNAGEQTRSVKTSWVPGDKINVWYEGNTQREPDLVIKYDGSEWKKDATATVSGNDPAASGKIFYAYEGGNDLSKYLDIADMYYGTMNLLYGDDRYNPTTYTYSGGTLSFNIEHWWVISEFQVVIPGIDPTKYQLKCSNLLKFSGFKVAGATISSANSGYNEYVSGVSNDDGAAFYFKGVNDNSASANYLFTLKNKDTSEEKTYSVTGKTIPFYSFTAIKIDYSKFE